MAARKAIINPRPPLWMPLLSNEADKKVTLIGSTNETEYLLWDIF